MVDVAVRLERTTELPPGAGSQDWEAYFRNYRADLDAKEAAKTRLRVDDEGNIIPAFVVTEFSHEVEFTEVASSPGMYLKWLQRNQPWLVKTAQSRTHHEPEVYADDSKKKPGQETPEHRKGDPKYPARDKIHTSVQGLLVRDGRKLAEFKLYWSQWAERTTTTFVEGIYWDIQSQQHLLEKQTGYFDEWLVIFAPREIPTKVTNAIAKRQAEAEEKDRAESGLLGGEDWNG